MSLASSGRQLPVLDGDGLKDIVIGKRWWSHGDNYGSPEA
jgi:hypothetical protein